MIDRVKRVFIFSLISLLICSIAEAEKPPRLNILLVTFDTTRADHIACYGYKQVKTPNIDRLAKRGCLFEKAFTSVPITFPSHSSMLTGLYPPSHGIRNNATYALPDSVVTLPEMLKDRGYATAAFVSAYVLDRRFGLDQGFDTYDDDLETNVEPKLKQKERRAETVTRAAMEWLDRVGEKGFFLWVHYFDPHDAWAPPSPYDDTYKKNPYDGEIAYADYWLGKLFDRMDSLGLTENTLILFAGDHGEGLGDHHEKTHGIFIYDSTIWVPMIISCPRMLPAGKRIPRLVRLIDITPTILEIIGYKIPEHMQGVSLSPMMLGKGSARELDLYCESFYPKSTHNWSPLKGLRTETWKYIEAPTEELYRLDKDTEEKANLFKKEREQAKVMTLRFAEVVKEMEPEGEAPSQQVAMDKETMEKMRSLGYVWTPTSGEQRKTYPDPKDMIKVLEDIDKGAAYFAEAEYDKALRLFQKVLKLHPENTDAYVTIGHIYDAMGEDAKSIEAFEKALELESENLRIYIQLGVGYMKVGRYEEGLATFKKALDFNPRCKEAYTNMALYHFQQGEWPQARDYFRKVLELDSGDTSAHNYLSVVYQRLGDFDSAVSEADAVLQKDPNDTMALLSLGSVYQATERLPDALDVLKKAVAIRPDFSRAHYFLGLVYFQQDRLDEAIHAFKQAIAHDPMSAEAHFNLGFIHYKRNNLRDAIDEFQEALNIKPDFVQARQMLVRLYPMVEKGEKK